MVALLCLWGGLGRSTLLKSTSITRCQRSFKFCHYHHQPDLCTLLTPYFRVQRVNHFFNDSPPQGIFIENLQCAGPNSRRWGDSAELNRGTSSLHASLRSSALYEIRTSRECWRGSMSLALQSKRLHSLHLLPALSIKCRQAGDRISNMRCWENWISTWERMNLSSSHIVYKK